MGHQEHIELPDGRMLCFADIGDKHGAPVFFYHPGMSSRLMGVHLSEKVVARGGRLIAPDRPGIGGSDPAPSRTLTSWARDVTALADALDIDRFSVLAISAGCSHAAACAHALPDRVERVALVSCGGPFDIPEARSGMSGTNRLLFLLAQWWPWALRMLLTQQRSQLDRDSERFYQGAISSLAGPDKALLAGLSADEKQEFIDDTREAMRQGAAGPALDMKLVSAPWGFPLDEIRVPVHLWHGLADTSAPPPMARWVEQQIPGCKGIFVEDEAHFSVAISRIDEVMDTLLK